MQQSAATPEQWRRRLRLTRAPVRVAGPEGARARLVAPGEGRRQELGRTGKWGDLRLGRLVITTIEESLRSNSH
jgi:hypothetical protein